MPLRQPPHCSAACRLLYVPATRFKLYYTPTSCGAASFIAATLGDLHFDSEQVDLSSHRAAGGIE
jgi:hypothetical protein